MTHQADGGGADPTSSRLPSGVAQLLSALFYGTCSFLIVLVNKALLTTYGSGGRRGSGRDPRAGGGRGGGGALSCLVATWCSTFTALLPHPERRRPAGWDCRDSRGPCWGAQGWGRWGAPRGCPALSALRLGQQVGGTECQSVWLCAPHLERISQGWELRSVVNTQPQTNKNHSTHSDRGHTSSLLTLQDSQYFRMHT